MARQQGIFIEIKTKDEPFFQHTIFGEVYRGMEIVLKISQSSVNAKTDKPWEDITIINANVVN